MSFQKNDRMSIFGALRPDDGQTVSRAVLATYSLDLVAMLGLVLALGGDGEVEFENSPLGLVQAFDRMRGKLNVIHQHGRIIAPGAHRTVLPLLDTMVRAIATNERDQSWHPKVALIRYEADPVQWRFWIGSRNLTGSSDLDAGLLLVSSRDRSARAIPDVSKLAGDLLREAKLTNKELEELRTSRWLAPPGVRVRSLLWRRPGETYRFVGVPLLGRGERASAVSPFIDPAGLREVLGAGCANVTVLTTDMEANDCGTVEGVVFRTATAPEPETEVSVEQQIDDKVGEFTELPQSGVHAKIIAITRGDKTGMMLGSANLTSRGLIGPNAEAVAILDLRNAGLADTLHDFVHSGFEFRKGEIDEELAERERARRRLDEQISAFLECDFSLAYDNDGLILRIGEGADEAISSAHFEVSPFIYQDAWVELSGGVRTVRMLKGIVSPGDQTALVTFRAASLADPAVKRSWVLSLPVDGMDDERRDRALLVRYVGASRFRDWLRSQLDGVDGTTTQRWSEPYPGKEQGESFRLSAMFTLETMLAAWARDPVAFERRISGMMAMLASFREAFEALPDEEERRMALHDVCEVEPFLQAVHDAIFGAA
ncbi:phospholipase D family protein [Rhizobium ruizarguesonis]